MKIIKPSYSIIDYDKKAIEKIEFLARTCYKSENNIKDGSANKFVKGLIKAGHEAMIESQYITVKFIANRGFSHELVRHRLANFSQESTRYANYSKGKFNNEITVIEPHWIQRNKKAFIYSWMGQIEKTELAYLDLLNRGLKPEDARGVLPIDVKTEINITANMREWRSIFKLRTEKHAHPSMRQLMIPLLEELQELLPELFGDIEIDDTARIEL